MVHNVRTKGFKRGIWRPVADGQFWAAMTTQVAHGAENDTLLVVETRGGVSRSFTASMGFDGYNTHAPNCAPSISCRGCSILTPMAPWVPPRPTACGTRRARRW